MVMSERSAPSDRGPRASNIGAGQWNRLSQSLQIPLSTSARRLKRLCRSASFGVRLHDVMQEVAESMSHVSCGDLGARWLQFILPEEQLEICCDALSSARG